MLVSCAFVLAFFGTVFSSYSLDFLNIISLLFLASGMFKKYSSVTVEQAFFGGVLFLFVFFCFFQFFSSDIVFLYFYTSMKQLLPFFLLPFFLSFFKNVEIGRVMWFFFYVVLILAYIEVLTPFSYLHKFYVLVFPNGIPGSYYFREGAFMKYRPGGVFLSPLTLGGYLALMIAFLLRRKSYVLCFFTFFLVLLTGVKSAMIISIGVVFCHFFKKIGIYMWVIILIFLGGYLLTNIQSYSEVTTSISAHVLGLFYGVNSISFNSLLGHGVGTSGYNFFVLSRHLTGVHLVDLFFYGAESFVGILCYQLGLFGVVMFAVLWGYFLIKYIRLKKYDNVSVVLGFVFFAFFSESVSTYFILFLFYYYLMFDYEN